MMMMIPDVMLLANSTHYLSDSHAFLPLLVQHTACFWWYSVSTLATQDGKLIAIDPTAQEEAAGIGSITVLATPQGDVCGVYKVQGCSLGVDTVLRCVRVATAGAEEVVEVVKSALAEHEVARVAARVRRRIPAATGAPTGTEGGDIGRGAVFERGVLFERGALQCGV